MEENKEKKIDDKKNIQSIKETVRDFFIVPFIARCEERITENQDKLDDPEAKKTFDLAVQTKEFLKKFLEELEQKDNLADIRKLIENKKLLNSVPRSLPELKQYFVDFVKELRESSDFNIELFAKKHAELAEQYQRQEVIRMLPELKKISQTQKIDEKTRFEMIQQAISDVMDKYKDTMSLHDKFNQCEQALLVSKKFADLDDVCKELLKMPIGSDLGPQKAILENIHEKLVGYQSFAASMLYEKFEAYFKENPLYLEENDNKTLMACLERLSKVQEVPTSEAKKREIADVVAKLMFFVNQVNHQIERQKQREAKEAEGSVWGQFKHVVTQGVDIVIGIGDEEKKLTNELREILLQCAPDIYFLSAIDQLIDSSKRRLHAKDKKINASIALIDNEMEEKRNQIKTESESGNTQDIEKLQHELAALKEKRNKLHDEHSKNQDILQKLDEVRKNLKSESRLSPVLLAEEFNTELNLLLQDQPTSKAGLKRIYDNFNGAYNDWAPKVEGAHTKGGGVIKDKKKKKKKTVSTKLEMFNQKEIQPRLQDVQKIQAEMAQERAEAEAAVEKLTQEAAAKAEAERPQLEQARKVKAAQEAARKIAEEKSLAEAETAKRVAEEKMKREAELAKHAAEEAARVQRQLEYEQRPDVIEARVAAAKRAQYPAEEAARKKAKREAQQLKLEQARKAKADNEAASIVTKQKPNSEEKVISDQKRLAQMDADLRFQGNNIEATEEWLKTKQVKLEKKEAEILQQMANQNLREIQKIPAIKRLSSELESINVELSKLAEEKAELERLDHRLATSQITVSHVVEINEKLESFYLQFESAPLNKQDQRIKGLENLGIKTRAEIVGEIVTRAAKQMRRTGVLGWWDSMVDWINPNNRAKKERENAVVEYFSARRQQQKVDDKANKAITQIQNDRRDVKRRIDALKNNIDVNNNKAAFIEDEIKLLKKPTLGSPEDYKLLKDEKKKLQNLADELANMKKQYADLSAEREDLKQKMEPVGPEPTPMPSSPNSTPKA